MFPGGTCGNRKGHGAAQSKVTDGVGVRPAGADRFHAVRAGRFGSGERRLGKLSDISQTYGAVSVVLSAIALAGVVLSLLRQVRPAHTSSGQASRESHLQLAALALIAPARLQAWSPPVSPVTMRRHQQHVITSLALGELLQRFRIGHLSVEKLAVKRDGHFRGEIAREQWDREGAGWRRTMEAGDRRDRAFVRLVEERYEVP
ncbi:DUF6082 family protein [Streptomyces erythrochromogenes]|uniref:DUF6082 family protein n=1 Tax=Streptomyces erythrochromogenes TaxID=285574 RepID=UPI0036FE081E